MRTMYDGVNSDAAVIPTSAQLVAGYVDGFYAWTALDWARFPYAVHVQIAVHSTTDAGNVLDVEVGDATPEQAVNWVLTRRAAGMDPTVYCNMSTWAAVEAAFDTHDVPQPHYWVAQYDGNPVIPEGAVAKQYQTTTRWDLSSVEDYWPGVDLAPTEEEDDMAGNDGTTSVNGRAGVGFAANTKTTVQVSCDPGVIPAGTTFRVVCLFETLKPFEIAIDWVLPASGTNVVHIPGNLVSTCRGVITYCSDNLMPFELYVQ